MKVWILAIYMAGGTPGDTQLIDNISTQEQCTKLGAALVAEQKLNNGGNRYVYRCFDVEKAHA